eukprot:246163-Rhodomonas_salina.3
MAESSSSSCACTSQCPDPYDAYSIDSGAFASVWRAHKSQSHGPSPPNMRQRHGGHHHVGDLDILTEGSLEEHRA